MQKYIALRSFFLILAPFVLLSTSYAQDQGLDPSDPYYIAPEKNISFTNDVKPILRAKCMACHACFDAPAQLNFTNVLGIQRGAIKFDPYVPRMEESDFFFRLETTDKSVEDFREIGFFSVLEGGKDSLLGKMIKLGYEHQWKPNEVIPKDIEINAITRKNKAPNLKEFVGYEAAYPKQGMPLAVTGLTPGEYAIMMRWLEQGAKFDEQPVALTPAERTEIDNWEEFLNLPDNEHRLVARYIFEHTSRFNFFFDDKSLRFFNLVRSTTPPGQDVKLAPETRFNNVGLEGEFFYRFIPTQVEVHHKRHIPLDATDNRLARYKKIFFSEPFTVDQLPEYGFFERLNPLETFKDIPAKARYRFLLADGFCYLRQIHSGASCRGRIAVSGSVELEWMVFIDPDKSLYCNDAEYRATVSPFLDVGETRIFNTTEFFRTRAASQQNTARFLAMSADKLRDNYAASMDDIWRGDDPGDRPALTGIRLDDNAGAVPASQLKGPYPDRFLVLDFPDLERKIHTAEFNFDLFGSFGSWLLARMQFSDERLASELRYLRFLPASYRKQGLESLYPGGSDDLYLKMIIPPGFDVESKVAFETTDYKTEFAEKVIEYLGDRVDAEDPYNRPKAGQDYDNVTKAFQKIHQVAESQKKVGKRGFKAFLREGTLVRIDRENADPDFFTLSLDWDIARSSYTGDIFDRPDPRFDSVSVYNDVMTSYPNFMFVVAADDAAAFADALVTAETEAAFLKVVDRWGVRRTHPKFWEYFASIEEYVKRKHPMNAAFFDANRYIDP